MKASGVCFAFSGCCPSIKIDPGPDPASDLDLERDHLGQGQRQVQAKDRLMLPDWKIWIVAVIKFGKQ